MLYKKKNIALLALLSVFAAAPLQAKAQGLVTLSEEAMFDDELESNSDSPELLGTPAAKAEAPKPKADIVKDAPILNNEAEDEIAPKSASLPLIDNEDTPLPVIAQPRTTVSKSADDNNDNFSGDLFSQMTELEKKTTLMNLELRREKLQNEIEAVKNQRKQAIIQEQEKAEAARLRALEQEKELERKLLIEQEKLRELDLKFENLRQEKLLGSYKNKMLEENQKWIEHDAVFYKQISDLRQEKRDMAEAMKAKFDDVKVAAERAKTGFATKIASYKKANSDLKAQINVMRNRIYALEKERDEARKNPFAGADGTGGEGSSIGGDSSVAGVNDLEPTKVGLPQLYAITEVRGQGGELIAKLINKSGTSFYVKKGTNLQSGHVITEITSTYVLAEKDGEKDYIYFAAGGVLPQETEKFNLEKESAEETE